MGLSEREQQLLDEMERRLYQSEADEVQTAPSRGRLNLRALALGILVGVGGIGTVLAGVMLQQLWLGMVGFVVMLAGALLAFSKRDEAERAGNDASSAGDGAGTKTRPPRETLSDRMGRRWEERMDGER